MQVYIGRCAGIFILLLSLLPGGCSFLKNAGRDLVAGAREELAREETKAALQGLTGSVGDGLEEQIPRLDSLLRASTLPLAAGLRDELLGDATRLQVRLLRDELLSDTTFLYLVALRNELLGTATRQYATDLRDALLGEVLREQLAAVRGELIGEATRTAVQLLIDDVVAGLAGSYEARLRPVLREDIDALKRDVEEGAGFLTTNAKTLVWSLVAGVAVLLIIIGYFVLRSLRQRRMLALVTKEIDEMEEAPRKELTARIKDKALETGLEPHLHKVIEEQRLKEAPA